MDENPNHPAHRAVWSLTRIRFHRVVFNDWGTSRLCLLPPLAGKSKPPAVRVVVDSKTAQTHGQTENFGIQPLYIFQDK